MAIRRTSARLCSCKQCNKTFNTFSYRTIWCSEACRLKAYRAKRAS